MGDALATAGLLHSVYGTEGFQGHRLSFSRRKEVRALAGESAEFLIWAFCVADRGTVDALVAKQYEESKSRGSSFASLPSYSFFARPELGRFEINMDEEQWLQFITLTLADWLEQVEGASSKVNDNYSWKIGSAWGYRREAYRMIAELLTERTPSAIQMWKEVYSQESDETKSINQPLTPPQTEAALQAQEAMQSRLL